MSVYWNYLALLNDVDIEFKDIKDVYESNNSITLSNNNANEFIESIMYFIDDYLNQNIQIYKEYNFHKILFETMCNIIEQAYGDILNNLDINLYDIVNKSIELYLYTTNRHRSYIENIIVRNPDVKNKND